ncbi:DMT family transporter [Rufibacter quisquiliarum]|uniref:Drug/metabolite transporter (DMT)-like permease n=1 Tax=Rufibacter quisquiliarum TaxID=1549639 RepID=A0A839GN27_9BACT|nr:DMT family transporter [Rufibacter quisquiliarum]MBA9078219.1 drug/metabolite transporter (DMT)-like permease [Rufibacter quisquiliarum]
METPRFKDYLELHFIILLWGFTAILGKLISIPAVELVFFRTIITAVALGLLIKFRGQSLNIGRKNAVRIASVGFLIAAHWILFFASARVSSVSICLAGLSTSSLWTSFLEPLFTKKKVKAHEVALAVLIMVGLYIIFRFEFDHAVGIAMAVGSAFLASCFTIINSKLTKQMPATTITCYEMAGAWLATTLFLPFYRTFMTDTGQLQLAVSWADVLWIGILAIVCTFYAYTAAVRLMQKFSAYTMNLTVNLEPVYGILLAFFIFNEAEQMSAGFYYGAAIILFSVFLHPILEAVVNRRQRKLKNALPN